MPRVYVLLIAAVLLATASFWAGWEWRDRSADVTTAKRDLADSRTETKAVQAARTTEHTQAAAMADIGDKHEQSREAAQAVPAAVVADLRSGALRLRDDLARCETARLSEAVAGAVERDAGAQLREEVAGALVHLARDADDHVRACQSVIRAYETGGTP